MYLHLSCACMCVCQGNQSTRYQTGHRCSKSCDDLHSLVMYLQPVKSYPGFVKICFTYRHIIQLQCRICLCSHRSHLRLGWNNSIQFRNDLDLLKYTLIEFSHAICTLEEFLESFLLFIFAVK